MGALVNFGCGPVQPEGWVNVDHDPAWGAPVRSIVDLGDQSAELIVANHSVQMTGWHELPILFDQFARVLEPGGVLRILVPDVVAAVRAFQVDDPAWFPIAGDVSPTAGGKLTAYLTWYSEARVVFTWPALVEFLNRARLHPHLQGGAHLARTTRSAHPRGLELDSRAGESLIVEGYR